MKKRKKISFIMMMITGICMFSACSANKEVSSQVKQEQTVQSATAEVKLPLEGEKLFIYCGAGMKKPFEEIVSSFEKKTGALLQVTYGNAAQIISQITTSKEGDLFIAGDKGELTKIQEEYVAAEKPLVKHIPVIAVQKGNPKNIKTLKDFTKNDVAVVLGDNKATPIGKLADKALQDAGILDKVNIIARSVTAPEITMALSLGECDATIVWKENTDTEGIEVVESSDMEKYIKTIPAASLKCMGNQKALEAFLTYIDTDSAKNIWKKHGYEMLD